MATALSQRSLGLRSGHHLLSAHRSCAIRHSGAARLPFRPDAQLSSQQPPSRDANDAGSGLVLWRPSQHQRASLSGGGSPRRGALVVAQSTLFDRVSRLSRAYLNYYSDAIISAAEDPDIVLEQVLTDMRIDLQKLRRTFGEVLAAKLVMQKRVDAAAADLDKWTKRAEAAVSAGLEDDVVRAAIRRRRACQETVNQLRAQLAQHEAAANTLQGAISAMQSKMEEAAMRTPALKARWAAAKATQSLRGLDSASGADAGGAQAAFERAEAKIMAVELEGRSFGVDADITADDALEQRFAALEDNELDELKQRRRQQST